ncbi:hypothetical protein PybrP1_004434 [[Pythium] brassicae (nom. inval.)]|nr:hypothetical protein PybrP1_004434 [[Pythium] brassicae (nom. inval.)]
MWPPPPVRQSQTGWFPLSDAALIGVPPSQSDAAEYAEPQPPQELDGDAAQRWPDAYAARLPYNEMALAPTYAAWPPTDHLESQRAPMFHQPAQYEPPHQYSYHYQDQHQHHYVQHDQELDEQYDEQQAQQLPPPQAPPPPLPLPPRRKSREPATGRWNAEEHKVFLKGLERFQGPAWGEIARLIGTRTSTQVRTHAQKFFAKLARAGQSLPYFAAQIQRERSRLLSQAPGAVPEPGAEDGSGGPSVTPTSTSGFSFALANLSPHKRVAGGSAPESSPLVTAAPGCKREGEAHADSSHDDDSGGGAFFDPSSHAGESDYASDASSALAARGGGSYYHAPDDELFKPKFESEGLSPMLRKPRLFPDGAGYPASVAAMSAITQPPPATSAAAAVPAIPGAGMPGAGVGTPAFSDAVPATPPPPPLPQSEGYGSVVYPPRRDSFDVPRLHFPGTAIEAEQPAQQPFSYGFSHILHQPQQPQHEAPEHQHQYQQYPFPPHHHHHQPHHQQNHAFTENAPSASDFGVATPSSAASAALTADPWGGAGVSPRQWLSATQLDGASPVDAESLPSMNKLLFRSGGNSV